LDELLGVGDINEGNVATHVLKLTEHQPAHAPVYTLHAELEGMKLLPVFDQLLSGWKAQGYTLTTSHNVFKDLDIKSLPVHRMVRGTVEGRSGTLMVQGERVLIES
jgi:hypothetical protein